MKELGKCLVAPVFREHFFFFNIGLGWNELDEACVSGKQKSSPDTLKPGQHWGLREALVCRWQSLNNYPRASSEEGGSQEPGGAGVHSLEGRVCLAGEGWGDKP